MRNFLLYVCLLIGIQTTHAQTSYTWNGSISTAFNNASNWTPAGIPGTIDNITIVTGGNTCLLNANAAIANITLNSGQLNLNGFTLTVNGTNATFNAGSVQNGTLTVSGANSTVFGNGPTTMNCLVNLTSAAITIKNTTFQDITNITKTGTTNDASSGNNIFNGVLTVTNTGTGYLLLGNTNADQFNAAATFNNIGSNNIYVAHNGTGHVFNGPVTFNNAPVTNAGIYVGSYGLTLFNNDITVTSTSGQGVFFCNGNNTSTVSLATGKVINIGPAGFSSGNLVLKQFTQTGASPQNLTFTGTAALTIGPSSALGGKITYSGPGLFQNGCTYADTVNFTKTGSNNDFSTGNNIYNAAATFTNAGSGYVVLGDSNPDQYNADATFNNTGSSNLYVAHNSSGHVFNGVSTFNNTPAATGNIYISNYSPVTTFNGNIVLNCTGGSGIYFCNGNSTAVTTLSAGSTMSVGADGFTTGTLSLKQFMQLGATPQTITTTGTTRLIFTAGTTFNGDLTASAPAVFLSTSIFNGASSFTKTGPTGDYSAGGNIFNGICSITNSGSSYFVLGNSYPDTWNNDVIFTDDGSERLLPCWATAGNIFNGNIYVNTAGSAQGIQFCGNTTATATLAAGKTIMPGTVGLTAGYLYLKQFTQLGNEPINLTTNGASTLYLGPSSTFGGSFTATAPDIWAQGATYNSDATFNKTGGGSNHNNQYQNIFNSTCTINQQSNSGYFMLGYNSNDQFNDDIIVTSTGTGGIYLGRSTGGSPTQVAGKTVLVGGAGFSAGFLYFKSFAQLGAAPMNLTFTGTNTYLGFSDSAIIGGNLTSNTPGLFFNGAIFRGKVDATKTGNTNDASSGGNDFMDSVTLNNMGGGYVILGNGLPDSFYNAVHFNSSGSSYIGTAWNSAGNLFKGNITLSSTNASTGMQFCNNPASTVLLTAGNTIQTGPAGFNTGSLLIRRLTQLGNESVNLPLTGTASLTLGPTVVLGGDVVATSPSFYLQGCTFNGTSDLTKTGITGDYSAGGNIFNGVSSITNSGSSYWVLGNNNPDTWNSDVTFTNNGSERLLPCWASTGNQFNGNIYVNTSGSAQGIRFCGGNSTSTAILAAGKSLFTGSGGLNAGNLVLKQFTQLGTAPVNITMASTATNIQFGPASAFGGNVTTNTPGLLLNGCSFSGTTTCIKTGSSNDGSSGGNVFNDTAIMTNAGSGYLVFGSGSADQFNAAATFNNTGNSDMYVAHNSSNNIFGGVTTFNNTPVGNTTIYVSQNSAGTIFNDNIVVTSTFGRGIIFGGAATASITLAASRTISIGPGGFSAGTLQLRQFTQTGATPQNLTLTGTGNLTFGPFSVFGGNVTSVSPVLYFNGCTFSGSVTSTKTGTTNDYSSGNNIFNGVATMTNNGSGYLTFGNGNADQFNTTATFNNTGTSNIYIAHNSTGNVFNGVVTLNNTPAGNSGIYVSQNSPNTQFNNNIIATSTSGQGVQFCNSSTGSVVLSDGNTIAIGAGGFSSGTLLLRQFTQSGPTAQSLTLTGTGNLTFGPLASIGGNLTTSSPALLFNGCTFGGTVTSTKTGTSNDQSQGSNVFNGPATINVNGTGYISMANNYSDMYNGDVAFVQTSTGKIYPNINYNGSYGGNLVVTSPTGSGVVFGSNTGTTLFTGSGVQTVSITPGTPTLVFTRLIIANTGGGVTLNTPVNVSKNLALNSGLVNTTTSNILTMQNGSTTLPGTALSTSYVNGPMRYQKSASGVGTLNFPIGKDADSRPLILTVNHTSGNLYTYEAQLFNSSAVALGYTLPPSVDNVSKVHYYTITRTNSAGVAQPTLELSGNQQIQLFFGDNDNVTNGSTLTIVKNTAAVPNYWLNIGGTGAPAFSGGANLTGSVISTSAPSTFNSFSTFALANVSGGLNVLPVGLLYFEAKANNDKVDLGWATSMEVNNSYFTVEKSRDGISFTALQKVNTRAAKGNSDVMLNYSTVDEYPYNGINYYRLKQTDINGISRYSRTVVATLNQRLTVGVYPNPSSGTLYVTGVGANQTNKTFEWYDASGKLLARQTASVSNGVARLETNLRNGVYMLKFIAADGSMKLQSVLINK